MRLKDDPIAADSLGRFHKVGSIIKLAPDAPARWDRLAERAWTQEKSDVLVKDLGLA